MKSRSFLVVPYQLSCRVSFKVNFTIGIPKTLDSGNKTLLIYVSSCPTETKAISLIKYNTSRSEPQALSAPSLVMATIGNSPGGSPNGRKVVDDPNA